MLDKYHNTNLVLIKSNVGEWNGSCMKDQRSPRILPKYLYGKAENTPELCMSSCKAKGYMLSGVEYRAECWCGNIEPADSYQAPPGDCDLACPGDKGKMCGGGWRINVYATSTVYYK